MTDDRLKQLTNKELKKEAKNLKTLIVIMSITLLGLLYFGLRDYLSNHNMTPVTIVAICTLGGLISLIPRLKSVRRELRDRGM